MVVYFEPALAGKHSAPTPATFNVVPTPSVHDALAPVVHYFGPALASSDCGGVHRAGKTAM